MAEPERLLSVEEAAERLGLSPLTVADKLRAGTLPGFKYGRLWRLREADLDEHVRQLAAAGAVAQAARQRKAKAAPNAATKANATRGVAGRSAAARKANETRGPEGRSEAARKANAIRKAREGEGVTAAEQGREP